MARKMKFKDFYLSEHTAWLLTRFDEEGESYAQNPSDGPVMRMVDRIDCLNINECRQVITDLLIVSTRTIRALDERFTHED